MRVLTAIDRDEIAALRKDDEFFWLDLLDPSESQVDEAIGIFGVHELAAKAFKEPDPHPWLETFDDAMVLVYFGARRDAGRGVALIEVEMVLTGDFLLTVRHEACPELDSVRELLGRRPPANESQLVYRVLDALTDSFLPVLTDIEGRIDEVEDQVLDESERSAPQRIQDLRRELVGLRAKVLPMRDMFARAGDDIGELPGLEQGSRDYFRDIYADLIRLAQQIDAARDLLTSAMDVYLSTVSNRMNDVMKRLTIVATIFLPLAFVTGFFGQNFGWLVRDVNSFRDFAIFGLGGLLLPLLLMLYWFRRSRFF